MTNNHNTRIEKLENADAREVTKEQFESRAQTLIREFEKDPNFVAAVEEAAVRNPSATNKTLERILGLFKIAAKRRMSHDNKN